MKKATLKKTPAFTMLELIFVIVVVGILAAVIMPRMQQSRLREAADQIASHIRYTQHLAMQDDKYDPVSANWFQTRWQILFQPNAGINGAMAYSVFSDSGAVAGIALDGIPNANEVARNPLDPSKLLSGNVAIGNAMTRELSIGRVYGITGVVFGDACNADTRITFDYLGRPIQNNPLNHNGAYGANILITRPCVITITNNAGERIAITIQPETGYASVGQIF